MTSYALNLQKRLSSPQSTCHSGQLRQLGEAPATIGHMEKGRSRAGLDVVGRLCEALQISFADTAGPLGYRLPRTTFDLLARDLRAVADMTAEEAQRIRDLLAGIRSRRGHASSTIASDW